MIRQSTGEELMKSESFAKMREFWKDRPVMVTGGSGFLGSHLVDQLKLFDADVYIPRSYLFDLTRQGDVSHLFETIRRKPDIVFHLAATVGGIGANVRLPANFLFDNTTMNVNVARESLRVGVRKFVAVGSVCAYPENTPVPFSEDDLFNGYPEKTNAPYGISKRLLLVYLWALRTQYGFNGVMALPTNLYGPRDNFGVGAHVIPMLMQRIQDAKDKNADSVSVWGTGKATRDFLYVKDCVTGLMSMAQTYDEPEPVNLGTGTEISIDALACALRRLIGFAGGIDYDPNRPDGQPRRCLDITRANTCLDWWPTITIDNGLRITYDWWGEHCG
jgi:nucleoside-diphosphate-sugar epimerase